MTSWVAVMLMMVLWSGYSFAAAYSNDVAGFWQMWNRKTNLPAAVIAIYPYQGKIYGRLVATDNFKKPDPSVFRPIVPKVIG